MTKDNPPETRHNRYTYAKAGVDIDAGNAFVRAIAPLAKATRRPGADASLGGFGALCDPKAAGYLDPILVATTDGVGTKLKIAIETRQHSTIGIDLVAMNVNDLIVQGAEPLFFLDYFACGKLDIETAERVVAGIAEGCRQANCALIGGETAEMPGLYAAGDYDLAGFSVGAVERDRLLPQSDLTAGDQLVGIASSGIHSNGYSLVRRIAADLGHQFDRPAPFENGITLGEALLRPTRIYVRSLMPLIKAGRIKALAHITGGGLTENVPRVLKTGLSACFDLETWSLPPVFRWLMTAGGIEETEMLRTFNCGIGMVAVVAPKDVNDVISALKSTGDDAILIGELIADKAESRVVYRGSL